MYRLKQTTGRWLQDEYIKPTLTTTATEYENVYSTWNFTTKFWPSGLHTLYGHFKRDYTIEGFGMDSTYHYYTHFTTSKMFQNSQCWGFSMTILFHWLGCEASLSWCSLCLCSPSGSGTLQDTPKSANILNMTVHNLKMLKPFHHYNVLLHFYSYVQYTLELLVWLHAIFKHV